MTRLYNRLTPIEKELVDRKMAKKLKSSTVLIRGVLEEINPDVKIANDQVIVMYKTLKRIEQEVKHCELSWKSEA
ncbi:hypothetical protein ABW636_04145 [Aquimarina sp. 2201CG1-2-11]|uniref:hypothetical protein n=1 Tax=Aquimarina discodermiae TaxID=3231043 RepID=UPI0034637854